VWYLFQRTYRSRDTSKRALARINSLCTSILRASFLNTEDDATLRSVLAAALFTLQFSPTAIPRTVCVQTGEGPDVDEVVDFLESI